MAAPKAVMVRTGEPRIRSFPPAASATRTASRRRLRLGRRARAFPRAVARQAHCYDADIQAEALAWFDIAISENRDENSTGGSGERRK